MRTVPKSDVTKPAIPAETVSDYCLFLSVITLFSLIIKEEDLKWVEENLPTTTLDKLVLL